MFDPSSLLLELNAARFYEDCAEQTPIDELSGFFSKLAEWEHAHYHDLLKIQEESERYFWETNNFEPF